MSFTQFFFMLFAFTAFFCAVMVVLSKNPVTSAFNLVLVFFSLAGLYGLMEAHLVAALQIFVYTGAIMVLFVFVIMLLSADAPSLDMKRAGLPARLVAVALGGALFGSLIWVFQNGRYLGRKGMATPEAIEAAGGNARVLSEALFSEYLLPFELTSVLLLAGIVAAVAMAKRKNLYFGPKRGGT